MDAMDAPVHPQLAADGDLERRNLAALRQVQPGLVARLESAAIPRDAEPVTGRDGSPTYLIRVDGQRRWFGGSSMPSVSAPTLLERFDAGPANVFLPTAGTGREAKLLAARLDAHCAVFVYERDPCHLRLALSLNDLSAEIASGRVVLLSGDDVTAELMAFFESHVGYEFPARMLSLPNLDSQQTRDITAALATASRSVAEYQLAKAQEWSSEVRARREFSLGGSPRLLVLTVDPRTETIAAARAIENAARAAGWPAAGCLPDSPARCHTVARLSAIRDHRPELVLTINCFPGRLGKFLGESQPIAHWFLPDAAAGAAQSEGLPDRGLTFAATPALCDQFVEVGLPRDRVDLLEVGTDPQTYKELDPNDPDVLRHRCDVAVLCDVADLGPQAGHVGLQTHVRLFETLVRSAPSWADDYAADHADAILTEAERRCERSIKEQRIRASFLHLIRNVIAPTLVARRTVERLAKAGLTLKVWGRHWTLPGRFRSAVQGLIPPAAERNHIFNAARVVVCPVFAATTPQRVLDVLAAGGHVVYRKPDQPVELLHPQSAGVLSALPSYRRLSDAHAVVSKTLRRIKNRPFFDEEPRRSVFAEHTLTRRLETIRHRAEQVLAPKRA
jgi:hypothetical protein